MSRSKLTPTQRWQKEADKLTDQLLQRDDDRVENYEVERKGDMVSIGLGFIPAFEVPRETAVKLAALILKKAGCGVTVSANCLTASWRKLDG